MRVFFHFFHIVKSFFYLLVLFFILSSLKFFLFFNFSSSLKMEVVARPCYCILHNLPFIYDANGKPASKSFKRILLDILENMGYRATSVELGWFHFGFERYAVIEFGLHEPDYVSGFKLEWMFNNEGHGKQDWLGGNIDNRPYLWVARYEDQHLLRRVNADFHQVPSSLKELARVQASQETLGVFDSISSFFSLLYDSDFN